MSAQWYPGHIAKWDKALLQLLPKADIVAEVLDARLPYATRHPQLQQHLAGKKRVCLLNKSNLADPKTNKRWLAFLKTEYPELPVLLTDAHEGSGKAELVKVLLSLGEDIHAKQRAKGLKPAPLKIIVAGMPNVGKSSLINRLIGQKKAQTGHKAGVTREARWIRVHPQLDLLDSPGTIPPRLDSPELGHLLALVSSIGEAAYDEEAVALYFIEKLEHCYPALLERHYNWSNNMRQGDHSSASPLQILEAIAGSRMLLENGGRLDLKRAAALLLKDFRKGLLGRLTLEHPQGNAQ